MKHDVVIVGAGAAGVGMAAALKDFGFRDFVVLDRFGVGASFERWPAETRFITPSFNSTSYGILDLNAITLNTSVANFLGREHPTGRAYASYLQALVKVFNIPVLVPWEVKEVEVGDRGGFVLLGPQGRIDCRFLIWAAGEFQFPRDNTFPGAELGLHYGRIPSFRKLPGVEFLVIGAFESGVDAAVNLAQQGKKVTLLCAASQLPLQDHDPSRSLSPLTRERLDQVLATRSNLRICFDCRVTRISPSRKGFEVLTQSQQTFHSLTPPILCTGFRGGTSPIEHLLDYREDGHILLTEVDESPCAPGLFLVGPQVRHDNHIFCFIYKFRQRFAVVAETLAKRLGIPIPNHLLEIYERNQMRRIDLTCCGQPCIC